MDEEKVWIEPQRKSTTHNKEYCKNDIQKKITQHHRMVTNGIYYISSQIEITFVRQEYRRLLCRHREITNWKWRLGTICSDKKIMDTDSYRILFVFRQSVPIYFKQKSSDNSLEGMKLSGSGRLKNLLLIKTVLSIMARWDPCVGDGISKHRTHKSSAYKAHTVFTKRQMLYLENLH